MGALKQHAQRVHNYASLRRASVAHQEFIDPLQNRYTKDGDAILKTHATDDVPAPTAINEMVVCHWKGTCSSQKCGCK